MHKVISLDGETLTRQDVWNVARGARVQLASTARDNVEKAHTKLLQLAAQENRVIYGVNTGFGALQNCVLARSQQNQLSHNIVMSHAIARGKPMKRQWVRAGMVVRINSLCRGHSGVSLELLELLCSMLNCDIVPIIPELGSLACSGDLCFLAHVGKVLSEPEPELPCQVWFKDEKWDAVDAFRECGLKRVVLGPKEGLALTNGSSVTAGVACLAAEELTNLWLQSLATLALSLEALRGFSGAFRADIHELRAHPGQVEAARCIRALTEGSQLLDSFTNEPQDAYSLRCSPQILGSLKELLDEFCATLGIEINSVTDNPILDLKRQQCWSGGNFHASILGHRVDAIKNVVVDVCILHERLIARMVDPRTSRGLPAMLTPNPGLQSGYMIHQYTAAALVLKMQQAAFPASVLSIPTCLNQEDHNSNAYNAVLSLQEVIRDARLVLAINLCCATRAISMRNCHDDRKQLGLFAKSPIDRKAERKKTGEEEEEEDEKEEQEEEEQDVMNFLTTRLGRCRHPDAEIDAEVELNQFERVINDEQFLCAIRKTCQKQQTVHDLATPRGTVDFHPEDMQLREFVFGRIRDVLRAQGVQQIDTPLMEHREVLFGKYGEESKKLVFDLNDQGGLPLTLRFDLTVPFARYMAQHNLTQLRRFQVGPVFRRDNPAMSKGRARQFYQFDLDIAGHFDAMVPDAEVLHCMAEVFRAFQFDFLIKFSHKGLLDHVLGLCGIPEDRVQTVASSIDKLDKEPWPEIAEELRRKGIADSNLDLLEQHILVKGEPRAVLQQLQEKYCEHVPILAILQDCALLFRYLEMFGSLDKLVWDLSLARGLSYYTGPIFEAVLLNGDFGSIGGGGRYDNLTGKMFGTGKASIPAVGCSFGIERICAILKQEQKQQVPHTQCYVTCILGKKSSQKEQDDLFCECLRLTAELRAKNIRTTVVSNRKQMLGDQITGALERGTPYMLLLGASELQSKSVQIKKLVENVREQKPREEIVSYMQTLLSPCGTK